MSVSRTIRVYLASSFADMKSEREQLFTTVLPELRSTFDERGIAIELVDLRRNAPDEAAAFKAVAAGFCDSIDKCRPYFIGLLGQTCGPPITSLPDDILNRQPWLKNELTNARSLLELEFLHGALRNAKASSNAVFYLRDLSVAPHVGGPQSADEIDQAQQLIASVRASGRPVRVYTTPASLGELVRRDLIATIDSLISEAPRTKQLTLDELQRLLSATDPAPSTSSVAEPAGTAADDSSEFSPALSPLRDEEQPSGPTRLIRIAHLSGSRARTTQEFNIDKQDEVCIGRDLASHVRYAETDKSVSRAHLKIVQNFAAPNSYILVSQGRNGTYINNVEVSGSSAVRDGDIVQVGRGGPVFRFEQFPKSAAQEGWQEPEPPPIDAAQLSPEDAARTSGATTELKFDPVLAQALLDAAPKPVPLPPPMLIEEVPVIDFHTLPSGGDSLRDRPLVPVVLVGVIVLAITLLMYWTHMHP